VVPPGTRQKVKPRRQQKTHQLKVKEKAQPLNDLPWVMKYHHESINLACIMNIIWNVNADTTLVNAIASLN